ncbi:MAG: KpsF/GutQ family sugar-phosphate isomerase [Verrucomicrobia bacterium]|nr:KpsF/GutQ family sugar-phosphate isomerase [Verrucomicrobiota bacterium]
MSHLARARKVFQIEMAALRAVAASLDERFDQGVERLVEALARRNKVVVVGVGKSGNIGRKIAATLSSTGSPAVVLNSVDALHGDLGIIHEGDVVLALSYSGESEELTHLLPALKRFGVTLVALTGFPKSTLGRHADVVLCCRVPKEACPFNLAPTSSTTATLVLGDALALAVADARGLKLEDFAQRHPAGAIGRALLVKVGDIMRREGRNAVAPLTLTVKEALLVMTRAKSGSVAVVDGRGRLVGVFTDGDLRRRMADDDDVLARTLREVMTPDPICIREELLAAEALRIFNERAIDDLIVVNAKHQPVGLVDSQDLPKLKLM